MKIIVSLQTNRKFSVLPYPRFSVKIKSGSGKDEKGVDFFGYGRAVIHGGLWREK